MKLAIKRIFLVYLATYFLVGSLGISFTHSTCLFTGNKKYSLNKAVSCCSKNTNPHFNQIHKATLKRAKCCSYDQYALKFIFDLSGNKIQNLDFNLHDFPNGSYSFGESNGIIAFKKLSFDDSNHSPPPLRTRLANLQAYLI